MARNTSVILGDHFEAFVDRQVKTGRYTFASDVPRASLRLLEEREDRLAQLRDALVAGENSEGSGPIDIDDIERRARAAVTQRERRA